MHSELFFLKKMAQEGPAPCDKFHCPNREACGQQRLACESYLIYHQTGEAFHPDSRFVEERGGLKAKRTFEPAAPTPGRYRRVFGAGDRYA